MKLNGIITVRVFLNDFLKMELQMKYKNYVKFAIKLPGYENW